MRTYRGGAIAAVLVCLLGVWLGSANAQTTTGGGPLVMQPSGDGPVITPDVKIGKFGGDSGVLVGAYGGWLFDDQLLVGAGGYGLVDHDWYDPVSRMSQFGFVTAWTVPATKVFHPGLRGFVGFGQATLTDNYSYAGHPGYPDAHHGDPHGGAYGVQFWEDFFVFEPQVSMLLQLSHGVAVDFSVGYRLVQGAGYYNDRLSGTSGSVGVRFGPHF
jgi:hypothetical protein